MSKSIATNRELWKKLYQMYMVDQLPCDHIAARLGYADENTVQDTRKKFGMPARKRADLYTKEALLMFNDEQEQILLGSVLGDGCIMSRTSRNPIYTECHSIHQMEYLSWKQKRMYPFMRDLEIGHKGTAVMMRSRALPQLGFYRNVFYPNNKKIVPVEILEWLDDLALAVWFMDDGTVSQRDTMFSIATCSFDARTNGMLQGWLATKYKLWFTVSWAKGGGYNKDGLYPYLRLQKECSRRFIEIIEPHIVPSMRYKLGHIV